MRTMVAARYADADPSRTESDTMTVCKPCTRMLLTLMLLLGAFAAAPAVLCAPARDAATTPAGAGLGDATVLIIRHAEKPAHGRMLTARGRARAEAYVDYFEHLARRGQSLRPTTLIATADTATSERPRLTLTPLAQALHLPLDLRYGKRQVRALVDALREGPRQRVVLVCWHHGQIPALLRAFGADPVRYLPHGRWPGAVFDWMLVLRFDAHGRLRAADSHRVLARVLPGDAATPASVGAAARH